MNVYVVYDEDWEEIVKVFANKKDAEKYVEMSSGLSKVINEYKVEGV
jgi:hypothetical protein